MLRLLFPSLPISLPYRLSRGITPHR